MRRRKQSLTCTGQYEGKINFNMGMAWERQEQKEGVRKGQRGNTERAQEEA